MADISQPSLFIAVPNLGWIRSNLAIRVLLWMKEFGGVVHITENYKPIARARNHCWEAFLNSPCSHLWFIDSDTTPPADAGKLLLDANKKAISGLVNAMKRNSEHVMVPMPMLLRKHKEKEGLYPVFDGKGIEQIDACGAACFMLSRELCEMFPGPPFREPSWGEKGGEDYIFCRELAEMGVPLYGHFDVVCRHFKECDI